MHARGHLHESSPHRRESRHRTRSRRCRSRAQRKAGPRLRLRNRCPSSNAGVSTWNSTASPGSRSQLMMERAGSAGDLAGKSGNGRPPPAVVRNAAGGRCSGGDSPPELDAPFSIYRRKCGPEVGDHRALKGQRWSGAMERPSATAAACGTGGRGTAGCSRPHHFADDLARRTVQRELAEHAGSPPHVADRRHRSWEGPVWPQSAGLATTSAAACCRALIHSRSNIWRRQTTLSRA